MDSNDLERERGITILAKNCSIEYGDTHINIVDTPGHADFGGEVERVLAMVDGVLLLVDAVEGPMPQTRFVTLKALQQGLKPIVVVNKVDRPGARAEWVVNQTFELFDRLGATDDQLDFPVVYASALNGWATLDVDVAKTSRRRRRHAAAVRDDPRARARARRRSRRRRCSSRSARSTTRATSAASASAASAAAGSSPGQEVAVLHGPLADGATPVRRRRSAQVLRVRRPASARRSSPRAAGDIVLSPASTTCRSARRSRRSTRPRRCRRSRSTSRRCRCTSRSTRRRSPAREGKYVTSRNLRERLREGAARPTWRCASRRPPTPTSSSCSGRGELHLTILIENMRREGYELAVSRPRVVLREIDGEHLRAVRAAVGRRRGAHQGAVMEALGVAPRRAHATWNPTAAGARASTTAFRRAA